MTRIPLELDKHSNDIPMKSHYYVPIMSKNHEDLPTENPHEILGLNPHDPSLNESCWLIVIENLILTHINWGL